MILALFATIVIYEKRSLVGAMQFVAGVALVALVLVANGGWCGATGFDPAASRVR